MECKTYSKRPEGEPMEYAACAVCGFETPKPYWDVGDFSFSRCSSCGLVYQYPRPKQSELVQRYDEDYFTYELENEEAFFGLMKLALKDVGFHSEIEAKEGTGRFLDVGCATGMLLAELKERGWEEQGVEVCTPSAEYGMKERGVRIFAGILEEAAFPAETFRVVHASHLIEHLGDPAAFLREVYRILLPGGNLIVTTPNVAGFQARVLKARWRSAIADHMYLFSLPLLKRLLKQSGFFVERWKTWGGIASGLAPAPIKFCLDRIAKTAGFGDVMVIRARKLCE